MKEKSCVNIAHRVDGCKLCDETKWEHCDLLIFAMQSAVHLLLHSYLKVINYMYIVLFKIEIV
ncbi:hypothetical protein T05_1459 [Trichinella murrelli]|uniref:Uncharacterized protein n=3 Tax=Trichinella TaxID=6333 RepID=A0A0V0UER2_9BILA|nr:hypothetical protein T05_1459 [Trichinella murrelli]